MNSDNLNITAAELYNKGISYFQSGNIVASKSSFSAVLKIKPDHSQALNNLGVLEFRENNITEAEDLFHRSCRSDPENYDAAANLANLYFQEKKYDKAEKLFLFLNQKEPGNREYLLKLGDCYVAYAEYNTAYNFYRKAGKLNPHDERIIKRINLLSSALTPLPFSISKPESSGEIRICYGNRIDHIKELEKFSFIKTSLIDEPAGENLDFHNPVDFLFVKDDPKIFKENLPVLCKILILDKEYDSTVLNESQRLNNIDFVFCRDDTLAEKLISQKVFADYQVKISEIDAESTKNSPENTWNYLNDLYLEMVLYYADILELQDNYEQANWILQKVSSHFPDDKRISERLSEGKKKIKHLFEPGKYINLYIESAERSVPNYNVSSLKRFKWLLEQVRSFGEISSLIDIGCHKGEFCFALADEGYNVTGIDIAEKNIVSAKQHLNNVDHLKGNVDFYVSNGNSVHDILPENMFDGAILFEILEHVPDVHAVLNSVEKVVRPGGYIFISVPCTHLETIYNIIFNIPKQHAEHVRRFDLQNIPVYFKDKKDLFFEEIKAESGLDEQKWIGIRYRVS
ncbi:methyltransferase domain-containing protein [candidate division KSB1 bacterium]